MKIEQSTVGMSAIHTLTEGTYSQENLREWTGIKMPGFDGTDSAKSRVYLLAGDTVELSDEARELQAGAINDDELEAHVDDKDRQKLILLQMFIEKLTGKKFKFYTIDKINLHDSKLKGGAAQINLQNPGVHRLQGWGMEYDYHESHFEKETMDFSSNGVVKTSDGREISFSVQLSMSREFASSRDVHIRAGDAALVDPLVINFGGNSPALSNKSFSFDLDCDGNPEQIHNLTASSGFLALDLNNDGIINDGRELFGPNTGDGFKELGQYDFDGNGWIDENDPIFDKLRMWTKDDQGTDRLLALGMKGVGAIYVGNVVTKFSLKDNANSLMGMVRETGIFLNENGTAGTIQHIDMVV